MAKLEAWKQKQALERSNKQKVEAPATTRSLLDEMDKKTEAPPVEAQVTSTEPQAAPPIPIVPETAESAPIDEVDESASPAHYAGKFDPKAIAKKATTSSATTSKLGLDVPFPNSASGHPMPPAQANGVKSNPGLPSVPQVKGMKVPFLEITRTNNIGSTIPLKARGNVSGFGLSSKAAGETEKVTNKPGIDFGDDEGSRKKLEKLPTPPPDSDNFTSNEAEVNTVDEDEDDEDTEMQEAGSEEEAAAAARAAAERREERLQEQQQANQDIEMKVDQDNDAPEAKMTNGTSEAKTIEPQPSVQDVKMKEPEEDVDELDAFMSGLDQQKPLKTTFTKTITKRQQQAPEALFGDDDPDLDAVGDGTEDILAMASKRKKKDIPKVNHAKNAYQPFRKSFYHEPAELSEMTEEELADLRLELDGIKVRGLDVPKPALKWSQCGLGVPTLSVIQKLEYEKPTSIQSQAIPAIMSGRDVIGVAKTGSGKTVAFLLPMFRHIKDQRPLDNLDGPIGLIMSPTRELATQIHRECKPFLKALNLRAVCAYGGAPIKDQIADLKRGAEIIVCTPGRMIDLLAANSGRVTNLRRVTYIVLDEADRMFDMGFEPQVVKILSNIRPDKQTVLFSATFPRQMEALARKTLVKPVEIVVGGRSVVAPEIEQIVEVRPEEKKFIRLLELLGNLYEKDEDEDSRALIFVDRQESADGLLQELLRKGYPCMSIHGGKDQIDRDSTINDFKAGIVPILIATSVAARGLDVKQLKLVVNYDAPNHLEDYVHRAGRTGRAGNKGTAVTFITEEQDRYSLDIAKAMRQSGQAVPDDVQNLVNSFLEKVKAGKEKVSGSGFGGKGLERLDQERDAARARERKTHKTGDEGDEEETENKTDKKEEDLVAKAASSVQSATAPISLPGVPKGIDLDGKIVVHKTEAPAAGSGGTLERVAAAVGNINNRLTKSNELRLGAPIDNKGPDAGAFHATLEINDFPRKSSPTIALSSHTITNHTPITEKARWAVTNRTNVAKILEATGTSITTKGSFYATGKEPQAGENPKLYILVEGDTEVVVTNAMRELMRLLKEGTIAAAEGEARMPVSGRYNVV